jgi:ArsR family transcriptional regulator
MTSIRPAALIAWLRAAGEPSRLRLLALCAEGALSVSDLAHALRQSEPRVSRHLKVLCEAGLLERLPQGQWVHYRVAGDLEAAGFVRGLLGQLDRRDPQFVRDAGAARAATSADPGAGGVGAESRLGRALAGFVTAALGEEPLDDVLVVGVAHPELLERAAVAARRCTALAPSRRAAQGARAFAERRGFALRVLTASAESLSVSDLPATARFDAVLLDQPAASGEALARVLTDAHAMLSPTGRLWLFERYESLEVARDRIVEHPLARLRRLLGAAGFRCERLSPVEADGEHVLAAAARMAEADAGHATSAARLMP